MRDASFARDTLIFGAGASHLSNTNDFTAGTPFGSILISESGYTLGGNQVDLGGSLQTTGGSGTVNLPLRLLADQSISASSGTLTLGGSIDLNGHQLTIGGSGASWLSRRSREPAT